MKVLKLTSNLLLKLNRLTDKAGPLTYLGADISDFDDKPIVAIVGTRKPTPYGKLMTERLAEDLARAGVVIISGLALGTDGLAHSATMKAGGKTIAVVASGLDNVGPATNRSIADRMIDEGGSILSEHEPGYKPRLYDFVRRNRIVVALSDAVIIPEATLKSGSLSSAKYAQEMKIPLFAVPGSVTNPMSTGTNYLLKTSAHAVTEAQDVLKVLGLDSSKSQMQLDLNGETLEETNILQKISLGISSAHELQQATKLDTVDFQTAITMLEVQGRVNQDSLGNWRLK